MNGNIDVGSAKDVDEVMKKYDRESNTRAWEGKSGLIVRFLSVGFSLFSIWVTLFSTAMPEVRLNMFLGMILILGYLHYPIRKGDVRPNSLPWYDILIMICGAGPFFYFALKATDILKLASRVSKDPFMVVIAVLGVLAYMELCRRCVGIPILIVVGCLLAFTFSKVRFGKVVYDLFYTTTGLMNTPINVCAKYIVVFIIFGAFLERTGISTFFINLANCVAGASAGGPAKVAVISSALCGMVSGSSVGNTVTTGSVTIPMMKRTGYKSEFAGAVEAAASTGGQIMPPIMGAAAFLMAEYMGIPYGQVALRAVLPAVLYFVGIYMSVHLEAKKLGLRGMSKDQLPKAKGLLPKIYLLAPLVILVILVSSNMYTMQFSATVAIGITILVGLINKDDRISVKKIIDALEAGGKGTISVVITLIVNISGGNKLIALFLTMLCCIVLGMGVPTTATYCIMAATCAPILISPAIGIPRVCAHFFVFYFGIVADITPPVALAAYAGSAIAKAPPMRTAFTASRLAIAAFICPYIFCLNPVMLLEFEGMTTGMAAFTLVQVIITSLIGLFGVAAGLNGHLFKEINPIFRIIFIAAGLALMVPGTLTDIVGIGILVAMTLMQKRGSAAVSTN